MAKKKEDPPAAGAPAWMATFADLMNLLLCFFVLLFSMSSVDEAKASALLDSLASTFSVLPAGGSSIFDGELINMGTSQLNDLSEYFQNMGQTSEETGESIEELVQAIVNGTPEEAAEILKEFNVAETTQMYDEFSAQISMKGLDQDLTISLDEAGYQYIEVTISGSVSFESGSASLKPEFLPTLEKIASILKRFKGHRISIIGHTDNIAINTAKFESNRALSCARAISTADYLIDVLGMDGSLIECTGRGQEDPIASNEDVAGRAKNRRIEIRIYNTFNSN